VIRYSIKLKRPYDSETGRFVSFKRASHSSIFRKEFKKEKRKDEKVLRDAKGKQLQAYDTKTSGKYKGGKTRFERTGKQGLKHYKFYDSNLKMFYNDPEELKDDIYRINVQYSVEGEDYKDIYNFECFNQFGKDAEDWNDMVFHSLLKEQIRKNVTDKKDLKLLDILSFSVIE